MVQFDQALLRLPSAMTGISAPRAPTQPQFQIWVSPGAIVMMGFICPLIIFCHPLV